MNEASIAVSTGFSYYPSPLLLMFLLALVLPLPPVPPHFSIPIPYRRDDQREPFPQEADDGDDV